MKRKEEYEVLRDIKSVNPYFDKEKFLEGVKQEIYRLYTEICNIEQEEYINNNCSKNVIKKIFENKEKYRINKDIDSISIQYAGLHDYVAGYVQVYLSIYFYDKTSNNEINIDNKNKYYNDIWIVSLENENSKSEFKCSQCGATMNKDKENNILVCPYCSSKEYHNFNVTNWKIHDIEVI